MKVFLFLLLLPAISFSQGIVGKWQSKETPNLITEFKADGTWDFIDTNKPFSWQPYNSATKYSLTVEEGISYITFEFQYYEHLESTKCKYILEADRLVIFKKVLDYENLTTAKEIYKTIEVAYTRVKE